MKITVFSIILVTIFFIGLIYFLYKNGLIKEKVFCTTDDYPEMRILEDNWKIIRDEIPDFDPNDKNIFCRKKEAWNNKKGWELYQLLQDNKSWVKGWWSDIEWYQFPLIYHNHVIGKAEEICPKTVSILKKIPSIQIAGYALLLPGTKMPVHVDETGKRNFSMACNMSLKSNDATLYVKNGNSFKRHKHEDGKMVIFDSNEKHYAENNDKKNIRVILYIDFRVDTAYGTKKRLRGYKKASLLNYPTINIVLDRPIDCGIYIGDSRWGRVVMAVDSSRKLAECHFKNFRNVIDKEKKFYFYNLTKMEDNGAGLLGTYMKGCKSGHSNNK